MKDVSSYLRKMTEIALEHDIIVTGSIEAERMTYASEYGLKLAWDTQNKCYVFLGADELIIRYQHTLI